MTSFEINYPRFFTVTGNHVVIDGESSFFSHISTYAKWNDPSEGYKKRLKRELSIFRNAHTELIHAHLNPSAPLFHLAMSSLNESISWIYGFINYIDETFIQYSTGKFGVKKAWHITTKLALAIINDIGMPRRGAVNSFTAGDARQINKTIFYACLRSLDKMAAIVSHNYKDAPVVSTELVKFLSMNTSVEAVDKLDERCHKLEEVSESIGKKVTSTLKDCGTVGNKVDRYHSEIVELKKRIQKLEAKK